MGLIDAIAEKASDKIAQHTVTSQPATAVSNVSPQFKNVPQGEMKNTPPNQVDTQRAKGAPVVPPETGKYAGQNTNPALNTMGAGESDVAPGGPPVGTPATPPGAPAMIATPTKSAGPVVGQKVTSPTTPSGPVAPGPYDSSAVGGSDYRAMTTDPRTLTSPNEQFSPVKAAASQPGFWDLVKQVGGNIFEVLGNIGRGLEGRPTITEQRLQREHEERMQGNAAQYQKDYLNLQQGFQQKQYDADNTYRTTDQTLQSQIAANTDANTKQQLLQQKQANDNQYELQKQTNQREMFQLQNSLGFQYLNAGIAASQGGGLEGLISEMKTRSGPGK